MQKTADALNYKRYWFIESAEESQTPHAADDRRTFAANGLFSKRDILAFFPALKSQSNTVYERVRVIKRRSGQRDCFGDRPARVNTFGRFPEAYLGKTPTRKITHFPIEIDFLCVFRFCDSSCAICFSCFSTVIWVNLWTFLFLSIKLVFFWR